ncbi:DUF6456 domain-containing protein [Rhizobium sp. TRM95111]|uniref:DUF6456 domain-containing protein n=1 Tax=Rhizobium alarense TaxID=2846851 RepID=UPI001F179AF6|nr:DUF6456 domain-containing protein [Rhizobium alarense]MCF3638616.1 DUF6456 domain-containing protein [Rhizobium alarense]
MSDGRHIKAGADRRLAAMLAFLARHAGARLAPRPDGMVALRTEEGPATTVSAGLVDAALRLGLARRDGDRLMPSDETRRFLKRRLVSGEDFRAQHGALEERTIAEPDGTRRRVLADVAESPLGALSRLKDRAGQPFLPETALAAGERLAGDFQRAGLQPRLTMRWEPRIASRMKGEAGGGRDLTDSAVAARARVARAVEAMGPELAGVALDVCCFSKGLETVERERQWPVRSAKLMLRAALMALARHYDPPPAPARQRHAWGAADFRPPASGLRS